MTSIHVRRTTADRLHSARIGLDRRTYQLGFKLTCPHCGRDPSYTPSDLRHNHRYPRDAHDIICRACQKPFPVTVHREGFDWYEVHQWGARHDGPGGKLQFYPPKETQSWGPRG